MTTPSLKQIQLTEHTCKQGHYGDIVSELHMRSMLVGPSGLGKTVLLTNMILGIYKGCLPRLYIWSPPIEFDSTWKPVKDYIRDHIRPNEREQCYFDPYDPSELEQVIKTQQKVIDYQKEQKHKDLYGMLIVTRWFCRRRRFYTKVSIITSIIHKRYSLYGFNNNFNTGL